jgi:DNA modification methylase
MKRIDKVYTDMLLAERVKEIEDINSSTPIEDRQRALIDSYMIDDFFLGIKQIEAESIDLCEVDPPYGIDLNKQKQLDDSARLSLAGYNEIAGHMYAQWLNKCFVELYRVMKKDSWLVVWFGPEPWFETIYTTAIKCGFMGMRMPGIWVKGKGQTIHPELYLGNAYEMFMYFRKGRPAINKQGHANVYRYNTVSAQTKIHPTERPIQMIQDVIETFVQPGSVIMSPFMGSGNTALAAYNAGMKCTGWDLTKEYKDRYTMRIVSNNTMRFSSHMEESYADSER